MAAAASSLIPAETTQALVDSEHRIVDFSRIATTIPGPQLVIAWHQVALLAHLCDVRSGPDQNLYLIYSQALPLLPCLTQLIRETG
jgi:hypothetical protein